MTENEAIEILEEVKVIDDSMYQYNQGYMDALDVAINDIRIVERLKRMIDMYSQQGHTPTRTISMEDLREMIE